MPFCDLCGEEIDEDEANREHIDMEVCDDCLHDGLEHWKEVMGDAMEDAAEKKLDELRSKAGE